ncbi:carcinoembryonic antigen-related cell adhesion molecule 8-like [Talpa occidentalis]|uniref:carcinoembryonic antigen-related cell adhesion molecule 8-like n=1 Tax=Talpa occidentalis TaxID=50954 RepID=UPI0023F7BCCD|nr:carcinoembryonic antigen-related cell adhesion molecule 8-like [Talpa occidentalis]
MEAPSAHGHRDRVPWQGLLLAASLSTFWIPPVTAQVTVEPEPANVAEGKDVLLRVYNLSMEPLKYDWYKGRGVDSSQHIISYRVDTQNTTPGPMYSSRETIYPNGSLLIRNVTKKDTGDYNVLVLYDDFTSVRDMGGFQVLAVLPKPHITSNNSDPVEHEDTVVLTCGPETPDTTYLWSNNSQSLLDRDRLQLSKDNQTLTLLRVTRTDTGPYVCETRNPVSARHSDPFTLNVLYGPDTPTIFPSDPYYRAGANLHLSCHAASNPPAHYSWLISGRPQQSTQVLFMPNITEQNSGSYTCLAHNKATGLNMTTFKIITVLEELPKPHITSNNSDPVEDKDTVVLTCGLETLDTTHLWSFRIQSLLDRDRLQLSKDNRTLTLLRVTRTERGPYVCETRNPVSARCSDPLSLNVLYGPDTPTIFPSDPYYRAGANLNLSCHAASNPPAHYSWLINGRPQQSTQVLFMPNITQRNNGSYTCLAHNKATGLNMTTFKIITVLAEEDTTGLSAGAIAAIVIGVLAGVVLAAALAIVLVCKRTSDKRGLPERRTPAPTPGSARSGHSASSVPLPDTEPAVPIYQDEELKGQERRGEGGSGRRSSSPGLEERSRSRRDWRRKGLQRQGAAAAGAPPEKLGEGEAGLNLLTTDMGLLLLAGASAQCRLLAPWGPEPLTARRMPPQL